MQHRDPKYALILPPHGGYRKLVSFRVAELIYDVTVRFTDRYIPKGSRTHDQMEQAARSGVQNLAEGSVFSATSKKIEMNLTNVSRSSLTELKRDYMDFLRHRKLPLWPERDPRREELVALRCADADQVAHWVKALWEREKDQRLLILQKDTTARTPFSIREQAYAEISANAADVLCGVALTLVDRQLNSQAKAFELNGGFSEHLYNLRNAARQRDHRRAA